MRKDAPLRAQGGRLLGVGLPLIHLPTNPPHPSWLNLGLSNPPRPKASNPVTFCAQGECLFAGRGLTLSPRGPSEKRRLGCEGQLGRRSASLLPQHSLVCAPMSKYLYGTPTVPPLYIPKCSATLLVPKLSRCLITSKSHCKADPIVVPSSFVNPRSIPSNSDFQGLFVTGESVSKNVFLFLLNVSCIMFLVCFVHVYLIQFYFYLSFVVRFLFGFPFFSPLKNSVRAAVDYFSAYFRLFPLISAYFRAYFLGSPSAPPLQRRK